MFYPCPSVKLQLSVSMSVTIRIHLNLKKKKIGINLRPFLTEDHWEENKNTKVDNGSCLGAASTPFSLVQGPDVTNQLRLKVEVKI